MIIVLSSVANEAAGELVGMFPAGAASLVTASNFRESFKAGISAGGFSASRMALGGALATAGAISGVISTISHFLPQEFCYINPQDRDYVCAEVGAFLICFLSALRCPKLNPPSPRTLSGLGMHRLEWLRSAHGCGVPLWPVRTSTGSPVGPDRPGDVLFQRATIIGGSIIGAGTPEKVGSYMRALSRCFSMPYLSCVFASPDGSDYLLADLSSVPDISEAANREALVRFLGREG